MNYKTNELDDYDTLHRRCLLEHELSEIYHIYSLHGISHAMRNNFFLHHLLYISEWYS